MINHEKLQKIEEAYLSYLPDYWSGESYKWKAIKQFQDHWDIEASDFAAMLEQALSKTYNLLASGYFYAKAMLLGFAGEDPNGVREAFRVLYDETRDLGERIERFIAYAEDRKQNHNESGWKNHYQDTHAVSVYLWLKYPDKYYIYKYGEIRPIAIELESSFIPKRTSSVENLIGGYKLCDEICAQISRNEAIISTYNALLTEDCYPDPQFKTLTCDVVFYVSRYYLQADAAVDFDENDPLFMNDGWLPTLQEYSPGFTKDEWLKLLNNSEVIGPVWGGTLAAFYDAGGQATCSQIGLTFGKSPMSVSGYCTNLAKRIHKLTGCPLNQYAQLQTRPPGKKKRNSDLSWNGHGKYSDPTANQAIYNDSVEWQRKRRLAIRLRMNGEEPDLSQFTGIFRRLITDPLEKLMEIQNEDKESPKVCR